MNTSTLKMALAAGKDAWERYSDFRDRKASEAYDALLGAADNYDDVAGDVKKAGKDAVAKLGDRASDLADDAGTLTAETRKRIEKALKEARESSHDYLQDAADAQESAALKAKKMSKRTRRKALAAGNKAAEKAQKKIDKITGKAKKDKRRRTWLLVGLGTALAAVGGGLYYWFSREKQDPAGLIPPRVEEHAQTRGDSKLVYSTETGDDAPAAPAEAPRTPQEETVLKAQAAEGGLTKDGEELLASLDEQLERHRSENEVMDRTARADEAVEDAEDSAKHRLVEDEPEDGNLDAVTVSEPEVDNEVSQHYVRENDADAAPAGGSRRLTDAEAEAAKKAARDNDARDAKAEHDAAAKRDAKEDGRA
ncbi:hypothetical protein QP119_03855 [Corynebacterium frankenforstense]|uniref:hypothetical protein n=1 Tax=Corynebacterium TaxID=1716 RepID=UPI0025502CBE|nr:MULTISPECIES: hypothetical protein [Corynebacterium]MDK6259561.1 hypothetical protein [Corynebacterium frankenforstense]MDK8896296.1 hypothetical protein [Corynebacterium sp. MSK006]